MSTWEWVELFTNGKVLSCLSIRYSKTLSLFLGSQVDDSDKVRSYQVFAFQTSFIKENCKVVVWRIWHCSCPTKDYQSQALSNLLTHFPSQYEEIIPDCLPRELHQEICSVNTKEEEWNLYFDGASTTNWRGSRIVLNPPNVEVNSSMESLKLISSHLSKNNISSEEEFKRERCSWF